MELVLLPDRFLASYQKMQMQNIYKLVLMSEITTFKLYLISSNDSKMSGTEKSSKVDCCGYRKLNIEVINNIKLYFEKMH